MTKRHRETLTIGGFLKNRRTEMGLSLWEVASRLGYKSKQFVWNWENDRCSPPLKSLYDLARIYKIPTAEIYEMLLEVYKEKLSVALKISKKS